MNINSSLFYIQRLLFALLLCFSIGQTILVSPVLAESSDESDKQILLNAKKLVKLKRLSEAQALLLPIATQGNIEAQYRLGVLYRNGYVIKADYKEAFYWFERSAKKGNVQAIYALGMMKLRGQGTERDSKAAEKLFMLAAKRNFEPAKDQLKKLKDNINHSLTEKDYSVFNKAVRTGHVARVKRYLKRKIDINKQDENGYNALMLAVESKQTKVLDLLFQYEPDYSAVNLNNETVLMIAVKTGSIDAALSLLNNKLVRKSVNAKDKFGNSAILLASKYDAEELVFPLIQAGADMYLQDSMNRTVYMVAKDKDQKKILSQLISAGYKEDDKRKLKSFIVKELPPEKKNQKDKKQKDKKKNTIADVNENSENNNKKKARNPYLNWSALMVASWRGDVDAVNDLVETTTDINLVDEKGHSALSRASWNGSVKIVNTLLKYNADVNLVQLDGSTALHWASQYGHPKVVKTLLRNGAKVNAIRNDGMSSLMLAASVSDDNAYSVKYLIKSGADLDLRDKQNRNALIHAVISGNRKSVTLLIENGSNVKLVDKKGRSSLWYAVNGNKREIALMLMAAKADVNQRDAEGNYLLTYAAKIENEALVKDLLDHNAKVDVQTSFGNTALIIASSNGNEEIVNLLITYEANINHKNSIGDTPLIAAAKNKHADVAQLLINAGADISKKNKKRLKAIDIAKSTNNDLLVRILNEKKKDSLFWKF